MTIRVKRPTISDVASLAGVSIATVSRVLQNPDVVTETTRKLVDEAVKETGYRANTAAQMLRRNQSNTVLVVLPDLANSFFSEILSGIELAASEAGLTMLVGNTNSQSGRCRVLLESLWNGRADGALLLNGKLPEPATDYENRPIVTISERIMDSSLPYVGTDNEAAAAAATEVLIEAGHTRIAHLKGPAGNILTAQRSEGFRKAVARSGISQNCVTLDGDFSAASGARAADVLLGEHPDITAIFCANDEMALGLISRFSGLGIAVPDKISVIGFDDISFSSVFQPPLTTIRQDRFEMGRQAMEMLVGLLKDQRPGNRTVYIPYKTILRKTVSSR